MDTTPDSAGWSELSSKELCANLAVLKLLKVETALDAGAAAALSSELEHAKRRRAPNSAMKAVLDLTAGPARLLPCAAETESLSIKCSMYRV